MRACLHLSSEKLVIGMFGNADFMGYLLKVKKTFLTHF